MRAKYSYLVFNVGVGVGVEQHALAVECAALWYQQCKKVTTISTKKEANQK